MIVCLYITNCKTRGELGVLIMEAIFFLENVSLCWSTSEVWLVLSVCTV